MRITDKHLDGLINRLNKLTGNPETYCTTTKNEDGANASFKTNVGHYHVSYAYGGCELQQVVNEGGAVSTPLNTGFTTKRDLYEKIHAFIKGIELGRGE